MIVFFVEVCFKEAPLVWKVLSDKNIALFTGELISDGSQKIDQEAAYKELCHRYKDHITTHETIDGTQLIITNYDRFIQAHAPKTIAASPRLQEEKTQSSPLSKRRGDQHVRMFTPPPSSSLPSSFSLIPGEHLRQTSTHKHLTFDSLTQQAANDSHYRRTGVHLILHLQHEGQIAKMRPWQLLKGAQVLTFETLNNNRELVLLKHEQTKQLRTLLDNFIAPCCIGIHSSDIAKLVGIFEKCTVHCL